MDKEELNKLYNIDNLSQEELAKYYNISTRKIIRILSKYGIKKDRAKNIQKIIDNKSKNEYPKIIQSNKLYNEYNLDIKRLSRDYTIYPLKKYEYINKDELVYTYLELNLLKKDLAKIFNCKETSITLQLKKYNIFKSQEKIKQSIKEYNIKNNIFEHHMKNPIIKEKIKQTIIEKYGVDNYSKTEEFKKRYKQYMLKKYGVENYFKLLDYSGRKNRTNWHVSDDNYEIINDRTKLIELENQFIDARHMAKYLNITPEYLYTLLKKYDIKYNFTKGFSSYELEIRKLIPFTIECNKKIFGKEIDIYIPEKKIGIEFNGNYWHSELHKSLNFHKDKSLYFKEKGIFLYHIFEYEWANNKNKIINQLNNLLGLNDTKIYARKCEIKKVKVKEKSIFLNNNHLQGNDRCSVMLGLYYENELVSLMTFCKPKFNKKYEWELSRFCCKANCSVIGGASKLFKYFVNEFKPTNIISYSDIAKTRGNLYNILGFKNKLITRPNYIWAKHNDLKLKSQCRKSKIEKYNINNLTESEFMHSKGYFKIYNSGLIQWIWEQI